MNDRHSTRNINRLLIALVLSLPLLAMVEASHAAVPEATSSELPPSARRTAARAIQRHSSTQWLSDVAERLRILEEQAERATMSPNAPRGAAAPSLLPRRNLR